MTTYYLDRGLDQAQIFMLQATLNLVIVVMEVPFGFLADKIGVRKVMIIGASIMLGESIFFNYCQHFWQFMLALVATGLYVSALSNIANSMMMVSLRQLSDAGDRQARYQKYLDASRRYGNVGYALAALTSCALVTIGGLQVPYQLQPFISVCALIAALRTVDPNVKPGHISLGSIVKVMRMMLVERRDIRYLLMFYAGIRLTMLLCFWIIQPRMTIAGVPQWCFGIVYATWALSAATLSSLGRDVRIQEAVIPRTLLLFGPVIGVMIGGLTTGILGFAAFMLGLMSITIYADQALNTFMFEEMPGDTMTQSTELAVASSVASLLFTAVAPFFGALSDAVSLGAAFIVVAVVSLLFNGLSLLLFMRTVKA